MKTRALTAAILVASAVSVPARAEDSNEKRPPLKTLWIKVVDQDGKG